MILSWSHWTTIYWPINPPSSFVDMVFPMLSKSWSSGLFIVWPIILTLFACIIIWIYTKKIKYVKNSFLFYFIFLIYDKNCNLNSYTRIFWKLRKSNPHPHKWVGPFGMRDYCEEFWFAWIRNYQDAKGNHWIPNQIISVNHLSHIYEVKNKHEMW